MNTPALSTEIVRFGVFEADLRSGELRKNGARVKVQELPFRALRILLSRPHEVVNREELRKALWPDDVFVDFDHGISSAINRLRDALGDSAENPIFVETVERRGYRWIAPLHTPAAVSPPSSQLATTVGTSARPEWAFRFLWVRKLIWLLPLLVLALALWSFRPAAHFASAGNSHAVPSAPSATSHVPNAEAEDFYLKGRYYWNKRTPEGLTKAVDAFTQAIVHDPGYAKAYVGLADCYNLLREYTMMPGTEAYPRALAAAKKAVELDDHSSEAHASLAFASFWGMWDAKTAEREFRRAIELDPKNAIAHHWYATYLLSTGRPEEALAEIDRARALDPSNAAILADKGDILIGSGQLQEAITLLKQMEATDPSFISPHRYLKGAYLELGDGTNFISEGRQEAILMKDSVGLGIINAAQQGFSTGGMQGLFKNMRSAQIKAYEQDKISPFAVAATCARMDDRAGALHYLQLALENHDEGIAALSQDSAFKAMRDDAQFRAIVAHAGFTSKS